MLIELIKHIQWKKGVLIVIVLITPLLACVNLKYNPRPWHDEGAALSVSKTLAEDGIYAIRNSDGYQTFGPIQSVGPTVLLPVALSFKLFGVGLVQGRIVAVIYLLLTLAIFYICSVELFGLSSAIFAFIFLLGSPAANVFLYGRQVLGEIPALGFFLAGWLLWAKSIRRNNYWLALLSGFLFGLAMITKSQYLIMVFGVFILLSILDIFYFRQNAVRYIILIIIAFLSCTALWWGWQFYYFGSKTFIENAEKLRLLASATTGLNWKSTLEAFQFIFGSGSGNFYLYWGLIALFYAGFLSSSRTKDGLITAFLLIFCILWISYFIFWTIPWPHYFLAPAAIVAIFIGKLYLVLAKAFVASKPGFPEGLRQSKVQISLDTPQFLMQIGTLIALISLGLWSGYQFQKIIRIDVFDSYGQPVAEGLRLSGLRYPYQAADYIRNNIGQQSVIETWERELNILTDKNYHFPDQSVLAQTHAALYRGKPNQEELSSDYFSKVKPSYVVIGWYARLNSIYDQKFISRYGQLITSIGNGDWRYDIYKLDLP